jgi:hypothetical protein
MRAAGECGPQCVRSEHFSSEEETRIDQLIRDGRMATVACPHTGCTHVGITAAGLEAMRLFEAAQALERAS